MHVGHISTNHMIENVAIVPATLCAPSIYEVASALHTNMKIRLSHDCTIDKRPFLFWINKRHLPCGQWLQLLISLNCSKGNGQSTSYVLINDGTSL